MQMQGMSEPSHYHCLDQRKEKRSEIVREKITGEEPPNSTKLTNYNITCLKQPYNSTKA